MVCCCRRPMQALRRPVEPREYAAGAYRRLVGVAGIRQSTSRGANCYDNTLAKSVIGLFEAEVIRRHGPWRGLEAVKFATLKRVDWFNTRRLLEPIGNMPPAEAEERHYAQLEAPAMAA